jgi:hypothetical protein
VTAVRVYVGTTEGPAEIQRLTEESPDIRSVVCLDGKAVALPISGDYDSFVRRPTGVVERLYGHSAYRMDVAARITDGLSWQLGALLAHALHAAGRLASGTSPAGSAAWATGEVDVALAVRRVDAVPRKLHTSADLLRGFAATRTPVLVLVPRENAADARAALDELHLLQGCRLVAVATAAEAFSALGLAAATDPAGMPRQQSPRPVGRRWAWAAACLPVLSAAGAALAFTGAWREPVATWTRLADSGEIAVAALLRKIPAVEHLAGATQPTVPDHPVAAAQPVVVAQPAVVRPVAEHPAAAAQSVASLQPVADVRPVAADQPGPVVRSAAPPPPAATPQPDLVAQAGSAEPPGAVAPPAGGEQTGPVAQPGSAEPPGAVAPPAADQAGPVPQPGSAEPPGAVAPPAADQTGSVTQPGSAEPPGATAPPAADQTGAVAQPGSAEPPGAAAPPAAAEQSGPVAQPGSAEPSGTVAPPAAGEQAAPVAPPAAERPAMSDIRVTAVELRGPRFGGCTNMGTLANPAPGISTRSVERQRDDAFAPSAAQGLCAIRYSVSGAPFVAVILVPAPTAFRPQSPETALGAGQADVQGMVPHWISTPIENHLVVLASSHPLDAALAAVAQQTSGDMPAPATLDQLVGPSVLAFELRHTITP